MAIGQQPFWGVGRLRLSVTGIAEPQNDKRNDSRLFCIYTKFGKSLCIRGERHRCLTMEAIMAEKLKIPLNLKHKPIIYCDIQGKDSSDAKFISLGHASWNYEDFSIKIFRKPNNRWSRQSEELTPERLLSATLLLVSQICDSSTAIAKEKIPV